MRCCRATTRQAVAPTHFVTVPCIVAQMRVALSSNQDDIEGWLSTNISQTVHLAMWLVM